MENKYYAPSLEEFHTGFEYEVFMQNSNTWSKETFYLNKSHIDLVKFVDIQYDGSNNNLIRVKYLDKEDIESLGFKYIEDISEGDGNIRWWDLYVLNNYELETYGWFDPSKNLTSFEKNLNGKLWIKKNGEVILEDARIKNKSELKFILRCLKISE